MRRILKATFRWHVKKGNFRSRNDTKWALDSLEKKHFRPSGKKYHMTHGYDVSDGEAVRRPIFRHIVVYGVIVGVVGWFLYESYLGWGLFQ